MTYTRTSTEVPKLFINSPDKHNFITEMVIDKADIHIIHCSPDKHNFITEMVTDKADIHIIHCSVNC